GGRQAERASFDAHVPATHGVAADVSSVSSHQRAARESKVSRKVALLFRGSAEGVHSLGNLDHALLAFALHLAGGGHANADTRRAGEQSRTRGSGSLDAVNGEDGGHQV